jgi:hypothetical protein
VNRQTVIASSQTVRTSPATRRTFVILSGLFAFVVAGCQRNIVDSGPDVEFGKKLVVELQAQDFATLASQVDPSVKTGQFDQILARMAAELPQGAPRSVEVVNWQGTYSGPAGGSNSTRQVLLALQYEFSDRWLLMRYSWHSEGGGPPLVKVFHIDRLSDSFEHLNGFWRQPFTPARLLVFLAAIILPLLSIYALIRCIRAPMRGRYKILWVLFILWGIGQFTFNWSTGASSLKLLNLQLLSSGFIREGWLGPWRLMLAVPLGAIVFLVMSARRARKADQP